MQGLQQKEPINMIDFWRRFDANDNRGGNGIVKFAIRLFAIVPNSAMAERIFSRFGIVKTKLRNRLGQERMRKAVTVKLDIDRTYGTGRATQRRHFEHDSDSESDGARAERTDAPLRSSDAESGSTTSATSTSTTSSYPGPVLLPRRKA